MKKAFVSFFILTLALTAMAQEWKSITSNTPDSFKKELISSSEDQVLVKLQVPGFYTTVVTTPRGEAFVISMPKAVSTAQAGEPSVPMTGIPVMIGDRARMDIRVVSAKYQDFENIEVAPSKGDFPRTIDPETVPYTYGECYSQDAFFPASNVDLYDPYIIRDFRGQNMVVYPFAYNPVTKTLRVYYDMTVEMYKVDDNGENALVSRRGNTVKLDPDFKSTYQRHFINYEAGMAKYTPIDEEGDLLIICYDNFLSAMTDFVNWKKTRGINTTIVGTSTAGSTASAIKSYIQSQYNANNNLTHVLLVGDVAQIPGNSFTAGGSSGYDGKGDNLYGQIVGNDIYNDLFIGRFSASSVSQVSTQVNRILTYERDLTTSATWCQNGLGISASAGSGGHYSEDDYQHVENLRTDLLNYGYSTVYQDYKSVSGYPSSTTTTISNHINSGVGIINYCNHGEQTGWQSHYYMNSNVNALTNNNKLPFIFSVACLVGQYDYSSGDCFAETWMHATNGSSSTPTGAIGGAFSYISQPWIPPMWAQDEFVDILVESYSNNIKRTMGGAMVNGMMAIFDNYSTSNGSAVGTYQAWVVYGDPTLMMRTKTPQVMNVTHSGTLPIGTSTYSVSVSNGNGAVATITDANHNILGKAIVNNGTANVAINGNLTAGSNLTLCVFGYNKVTYLGTIQVVSTSGPYISLDSYTPIAALVGQSTSLSMTFKNVGTAATSGTTTVTLSTSDTHVTINNPTKTFSSLAANATTTVSGFSFTLNNGVTLGSNVTLHYRAVNGSNTWEGDFGITPDQIFTVAVAANNANYGSVSGGGQYHYGESCTVTATPADGYMFTSWTQNGSVVSTTAQYVFPVSSDVNLVANFASGVMIGDGGSSTSEYLPSYNYYNYTLSEQIYTSAELGSAGLITSIAFYNEGAEKTRTYDFYMKTTTKSSFSSKTDWITVSSGDKVFSGSVTMVANDWTTITFSTPFVYDGTSNVVLVADDNTGSYSQSPHMACRVFTASNQALYIYSDGENYNPLAPPTSSTSSNSVLSSKNQIVLTKEALPTGQFNVTVSANPAQAATVSGGGEYQYGQTCTVTATPNTGYTFSGWTEDGEVVSAELSYSFSVIADRNLVANFIQAIEIGTGASTHNYLPSYNYYNYSMTEQIYTADEIGAAGTITCIAFYNEGAEKTRTYDFYLKATTKTSFSSKTDWVTVSASDKVFSGEVTMAANAWTFITFSTPFEYDGASSLVLVADDNTGGYSYSPHMACSVYNANGNQSIYIYSDGTNYNPSSPTTSQSSNYATLAVKNHLLMGITVSGVYNITATANPTNGGTVSGGGTFEEGETCTLTATANTGYAFTNWTKNGTVVSTDATYTFNVTASGAYEANFTAIPEYTITILPDDVEHGAVAFGTRDEVDELVYDFEDGTYQGWTLLKGSTGNSPNNWMHVTEYTQRDYTSGYGHEQTDGWMLSESYISGSSSGSGTAVTPDNYLVSPQVRLGGSITFWVTDGNDEYGEEHFALLVSTNGNTSISDFTQIQEWTLLSKAPTGTRSFTDHVWYEYTVDLSSYDGMGYLAIRHFNCNDMWLIGLDDITITQPIVDDGSVSVTFYEGESCTVTATPNEGYYFANWAEDGVEVSSEATYTFEVTGDHTFVANFTQEPPQQTVSLAAGLNWWSTNLDITLADLKSAIEAALGSDGTAIIKSQSTSIVYSNGMWIPETMAFDIREMYKVQVSEACEITLAGVPVNTSEEVLTINPGNNWIGFPSGTSMTLGAAFAGLNPVNGDVVKSQTGSSVYNDGNWVGTVGTLEPGQGYLYYSKATSVKTFTFGMNAK